MRILLQQIGKSIVNMEIKQDEVEYSLPFGASAEVDNSGFDGARIVSVDLFFKNTTITLSEAECKELLNVLHGKDCLTIVARGKDEYTPHTLIYSTVEDKRKGDVLSIEYSYADWKDWKHRLNNKSE
jgi:hypothetical protein